MGRFLVKGIYDSLVGTNSVLHLRILFVLMQLLAISIQIPTVILSKSIITYPWIATYQLVACVGLLNVREGMEGWVWYAEAAMFGTSEMLSSYP